MKPWVISFSLFLVTTCVDGRSVFEYKYGVRIVPYTNRYETCVLDCRGTYGQHVADSHCRRVASFPLCVKEYEIKHKSCTKNCDRFHKGVVLEIELEKLMDTIGR